MRAPGSKIFLDLLDNERCWLCDRIAMECMTAPGSQDLNGREPQSVPSIREMPTSKLGCARRMSAAAGDEPLHLENHGAWSTLGVLVSPFYHLPVAFGKLRGGTSDLDPDLAQSR